MDIPAWAWIFIIVTGCLLFCWYISPSRLESPTKVQKIVARTWIIFRRLMCFMCAAVLSFSIYILWTSDGEIAERITGSIFLFSLSLFAIYVGIVGQGWNHYGFSDDINLYKKVKKKYGLRW